MTDKIDWAARFEKAGALWKHDGNKKRPYARLTSGLISDVYFNSFKVAENPFLLEYAIESLHREAPPELMSVSLGKRPQVVFGPAMGGIFLAYELARQMHWAHAWFTEPDENKEHHLKRFVQTKDMKWAVAVEDTISTGGSVLESIRAIERSTTLRVLPFVLCLANRSGKATLPDGRGIYSLITIKDGCEWKDGKNPFFKNGKERVPPVYPKKQWAKLTKKY